MLHKFEEMLGLPEDSLAYEMEVRKEMAYYKSREECNSKDKGVKGNERLAKGKE